MLDFDERDLLDWALAAGLEAVELVYRAEVDVPGGPVPEWEALRRVAPNPLVPTYAEAIATALTTAERERPDTHMNVLAGTPSRRTIGTALLRATRS